MAERPDHQFFSYCFLIRCKYLSKKPFGPGELISECTGYLNNTLPFTSHYFLRYMYDVLSLTTYIMERSQIVISQFVCAFLCTPTWIVH